jgi:hypothetical protein
MFIQYANNFWFLKVIFHHLTVFTPGSMNKKQQWALFSADNFSCLLKGISFQLGKTRWNYYNQEEKYKD